MNLPDTPIACSLTTAELRDRESQLLAQIRSAIVEAEELEEGYAFRLPGERKWIALMAELMASERECCPFLTFELSAQPNHGPITVRLTGPAETKEFVKAILLERR